MRTRIGIAAVGLLALVCTGCSLHGDSVKGSGDFRTLWKRSWDQIALDSAVYQPTSTSPGACNRGSTPQACAAADRRTYTDLVVFMRGLAHVEKPMEWIHPAVTVSAGLSYWQNGLEARIRSLTIEAGTVDQPNADFHWANMQIAQGRSEILRGWTALPASGRSLLAAPSV